MSKLVWGLAAVGAIVVIRNLQAVKAKAEADAAAQKAALMTDIQAMIPGMGEDLPGMGDMDDHMLLPPPGQTITASGQVLGGLGRNIDAFDAAPYQYRSAPQNDFNPSGIGDLGFGGIKSVSRAVSHAVQQVTAPVAKVATKAVNIVEKPLTIAQKAVNTISVFNPVVLGARMVQSTVNIGLKTMTSPKAGWRQLTGNLRSFTATPLLQMGTMIGIVKPPRQQPQADGSITYLDSTGRVITKEEYDALTKASQQSVPVKAQDYKGYSIWTLAKVNPDAGGGVLYLINYDPSQNSAEGAYNSMAEAQAAIDAVSVPASVPESIPTVAQQPPPPIYAPPAPQTAAPSSPQPSSYDASNDVIGPAVEDDGFGPASSSDLSTPQQSPGLPVATASVQTPGSRTFSPPPVREFSPPPVAKKSNAGVLIGGGILAAAAALLLHK
jgi:hypothetical protein